MENPIRRLMDYQKFEKNNMLQSIIDETLSSVGSEDWGELSDDALMLSAAGESTYDVAIKGKDIDDGYPGI